MNNNKILIKNDAIEKHHQHQNQQKRYFPRISSWTSSLSSFAHYPRSQQQEFITTSQNGLTSHQHPSTTAIEATNSQQPQHHKRSLLTHQRFTNAKNAWWTPIYRRNTVNPEKVKNKDLLQQQIQERNKKLDPSCKNSSIINSNHHYSNDITNTQSIPPSSTAVIHCSGSNNPFVIKDWVHHSFDSGNKTHKYSGDDSNDDDDDRILIHQDLQQEYNRNNHGNTVSSSRANTEENSSIYTSNSQCSSLSSTNRFSFTSLSATSTSITNTTHFPITSTSDKYSCTTVTTKKGLGFTPMLLKTNKQHLLSTKFTSKISSSLYNDDGITLQAICCIWISAFLLLEAIIYINLISWYQQQREQQTTHDNHRDATLPALSLSLFSSHCQSEEHFGRKQPKECRSCADIYTHNRGNGSTSTTTASIRGSWHKKQVVYPNLRTALVLLISSSDVTPTIPTCWPPLTESKIITDAIQAMRPKMKQLWAEHNHSMKVYKQQTPVRPTERRNWMRQRQKHINKFYNNKHYKDDKEDYSSSSDKQIVMNLAIETLEYFEKWYDNNRNTPIREGDIDDQQQQQQQQTGKDIFTQLKAIHWLRQITSAAATIV